MCGQGGELSGFAVQVSAVHSQAQQHRLLAAQPQPLHSRPFPFPLSSAAHTTTQVKNVAFRYSSETPVLFKGAELGVDSKSRIVLLGENGNGKTTLVKLLLGDLEATEGEIFRAGGARIALVNQHHADQVSKQGNSTQPKRKQCTSSHSLTLPFPPPAPPLTHSPLPPIPPLPLPRST